MAEVVECRSDTEYAERPIALHWEGERLEIGKILARWQTPATKHFRIITKNEHIFEIAYSKAEDSWTIQAS